MNINRLTLNIILGSCCWLNNATSATKPWSRAVGSSCQPDDYQNDSSTAATTAAATDYHATATSADLYSAPTSTANFAAGKTKHFFVFMIDWKEIN